jgi:hypothetical protein
VLIADKPDRYKYRTAVTLGAMVAPHRIKIEKHIFVADKGDYYDIADGLAQKATF